MSGQRPLLLIGGGGRMGRAVLDLLLDHPIFEPRAVLLRGDPPEALPGEPQRHTSLDAFLGKAPGAVTVDFSVAEGIAERVERIAAAGHPLVVGTTGWSDADARGFDRAAQSVAMVVAPNTSPGIALLRRALKSMRPAAVMGWDAAVIDRHHRLKIDAPSGTARVLEGDLRGVLNQEVPVVSLRQGGVVGEHTVHLSGTEEELVFGHRAWNRRVFARGALLAAAFAADAPPGRYGMDDVLGLPPL